MRLLFGERPKVVAITGSTKFEKEFREAAEREVLEGNIVLTVQVFRHNEDWRDKLTEEDCQALDVLFEYYIAACEELLVINKGGYIGEGTKRDIKKAYAAGKKIRFLEPDRLPAETREYFGYCKPITSV